jgi:FkbM family methyltransferase
VLNFNLTTNFEVKILNLTQKIQRQFAYYLNISLLLVYRKTRKSFRNLIFGDFDIGNFKKLLPNNPLIIEVGANDGTTTIEFIRSFKEAKIICFEPDARAIIEFKKNRLPPNVELFTCALSDEKGATDLYQSSKRDKIWTYSSSISKPLLHKYIYPEIYFNNSSRVETETLQNFALERGISRIDLLWLDTQGSERNILLGAGEDLIQNIDFIYLEYSLFRLYSGSTNLRNISKLLKNHYILALHQNDVLFARK